MMGRTALVRLVRNCARARPFRQIPVWTKTRNTIPCFVPRAFASTGPNIVEGEIIGPAQSDSDKDRQAKLQQVLKKTLTRHQKLMDTDGAEKSEILQSLKDVREVYEDLEQYFDALTIEESYHSYLEDDDHYEKAQCLHRMGNLYIRLGDYRQAQQSFLKAFNINTSKLYPDLFHGDVATNLNGLAMVEVKKNQDTRKALDYLEQAEEHLKNHGVSLQELTSGNDNDDNDDDDEDEEPQPVHPKLVPILDNKAKVYRMEGHYEAALRVYAEIFHLLDDSADDEETKQNLQLDMADCYLANEDIATAQRLFEILLAQQKDPRSTTASVLYHNLGLIHAKLNQPKKAMHFLQLAKETKLEHVPMTHPEIGRTVNVMGVIYAMEDDSESGLACFREALLIARMHTVYEKEEDDPLIQNILRNISLVERDVYSGGDYDDDDDDDNFRLPRGSPSF